MSCKNLLARTFTRREMLKNSGFGLGAALLVCFDAKDMPIETDNLFEFNRDSSAISTDNASSLDPDTILGLDYKYDTVLFGSYVQTPDADPEPLEWYVIAQKEIRQLLLSKYVLVNMPYNESKPVMADNFGQAVTFTPTNLGPKEVTWETCSLRLWLNSEFIETAFTEAEQLRIAEMLLENKDNEDFGTDGGNDTLDKVFCLSIGELKEYLDITKTWKQIQQEHEKTEYFNAQGKIDYSKIYTFDPAYKDLVAHATKRAEIRGIYGRTSGEGSLFDGCSVWWLRSPGYGPEGAACVLADGRVDSNGMSVNTPHYGVRPALWLNIEG